MEEILTAWKEGLEADSQSLHQPRWNATHRQDAEIHIAEIGTILEARKKERNELEARYGGLSGKAKLGFEILMEIILPSIFIYFLYLDIRRDWSLLFPRHPRSHASVGP